MKLSPRLMLLAAAAALLLTGSLPAQNAPPSGQRPAPHPPENLQVLPKDIPQQELIGIMRGYTQQLGVGCEFCHAPNPQPKSVDTNPHKAKARVMIAMMQDINAKYLTQLGDEHKQITCGNCHLGHEEPPTFTPAPREGGRGPGGPGAPPSAATPAPPQQ